MRPERTKPPLALSAIENAHVLKAGVSKAGHVGAAAAAAESGTPPASVAASTSSDGGESQHQLWGHLEVKVTCRCARASYAVAHKEGSKQQRSSLDPTQRTKRSCARGARRMLPPYTSLDPPEGLAARGRAVGRDVRRRVPARAARADDVHVEGSQGRVCGWVCRIITPPSDSPGSRLWKRLSATSAR